MPPGRSTLLGKLSRPRRVTGCGCAGKKARPPVTPPAAQGLRVALIESGLAQELDGEVRLDYEPAGVVCQIVMPVPQELSGWSHD